MLLDILIFMLLDSRGEDKMFWTEWWQALPKFNLFLFTLESYFDLLLSLPNI
jgi:hypothetical protein